MSSASPPAEAAARSPVRRCAPVVCSVAASTPSPPRAQTPRGGRLGAGGSLLSGLCFVAVTVLTTAYSLLVEVSKRRSDSGSFQYSPLAVTFTAETLKLAFSLSATHGGLARLRGRAPPPPPPPLLPRDVALASVPALLYCIHNNLAFVAMRHLTPPLYQLLSQTKIVVTAALARLILQQHLSRLQWSAVALLTLGSALPGVAAFYGGRGSVSGADWGAGAAAMLFVSLTSGLASVHTERLLKQAPGSTHFKNSQLYACGCALYAPAVLLAFAGGAMGGPASFAQRMFAGWTALTWLLVGVLAAQGLCISFLLRWASSYSKLFAGGAATFSSIALSRPLLGVAPSLPDVAAAAVVAIALVAFHWRELHGEAHAQLSPPRHRAADTL